MSWPTCVASEILNWGAVRKHVTDHLNAWSFVEPQLLFLSSERAAAYNDFESVLRTATFASIDGRHLEQR